MGSSHISSAQPPGGVGFVVLFAGQKAGSERCSELPRHTQRVGEASGSEAHVPWGLPAAHKGRSRKSGVCVADSSHRGECEAGGGPSW